ncbi:hypothetical protein KY337_04140 [Candidatus Woesearchaeota archaeon]|nr:hypothetical protein [Candidatus Woesearchaeota archaeon]
MKIFVTVGNGKFEKLVKKIDELVGSGRLKDEVVMQIGRGDYKPQHCKFFDFAPSLAKYETAADIVISHGGPGCIFEILDMRKRLIGVPNVERTDPMHQVEYLRAISNTGSLILCEDIDHILDYINKARTFKFKPYKRLECNMDKFINEFIETHVKG